MTELLKEGDKLTPRKSYGPFIIGHNYEIFDVGKLSYQLKNSDGKFAGAIRHEDTVNFVFVSRPGKFFGSDTTKTAPTIKARRQVVAGTYGIVGVCDGMIEIMEGRHSANELREAAHVLNQIAEIMDQNDAT